MLIIFFYFNYSVASGDADTNSVIIWTKLDAYSKAEVIYEISEDSLFNKIIKSGKIITDSSRDWTIKVLIDGLEPGKTYFYRFKYKDKYSPIGKTKTLPKETNHFRIALLSCQHFSENYFWAYKYLADDSVDIILFLGDFIYEFNVYRNPRRADPTLPAQDLETYRSKYKIAHSDTFLKLALSRIPIYAIWDDHEVMNDYAGKVMRYYNPKRLYDAYKAFFEYIPIRDNDSFRIYRSFKVGNLIDIFLIDGRQYRDEMACRPTFNPKGDCYKVAFSEGRTLLGKEQKNWLINNLKNSKSIWKLIANNVMFMDLFKDNKPLNVDQWDGYYFEKMEILKNIKDIKNVIFSTGDTHVFYFGEVIYNKKPIAYEIITAGVSSPSSLKAISDTILKQNPHIKFMNAEYRGYVILDFYKDSLNVYFYGTKENGERILIRKEKINAK
ncbi:MAG: alkaline phosphatase D family protein [Candidatus Hydrothermia bacterium]|nr:alkaline phosphatase D family protein [Candidatus Hydrothermia bacterium]